jgi:hypothetical protein
VLGSIGTATYRGVMAEAAARTPTRRRRRGEQYARRRRGDGRAAAGSCRHELLTTAREAFAQALEPSAIVCIAIVLLTALTTALLLRRLRSEPSTDTGDDRLQDVVDIDTESWAEIGNSDAQGAEISAVSRQRRLGDVRLPNGLAPAR